MKTTAPEIDLIRSGKPTFSLSLNMHFGEDGEGLASTSLSNKEFIYLLGTADRRGMSIGDFLRDAVRKAVGV